MDARAALSQLACPLIPVVVIDTLSDAVPVAEALLRGGISALEITLRTPVACAHSLAASPSSACCVGRAL